MPLQTLPKKYSLMFLWKEKKTLLTLKIQANITFQNQKHLKRKTKLKYVKEGHSMQLCNTNIQIIVHHNTKGDANMSLKHAQLLSVRPEENKSRVEIKDKWTRGSACERDWLWSANYKHFFFFFLRRY